MIFLGKILIGLSLYSSHLLKPSSSKVFKSSSSNLINPQVVVNISEQYE